MQRGLRCRCPPPPSTTAAVGGGGAAEWEKIVEENAVVMFAQRGCFMSHVVRQLLRSVGTNPTVFEVDERDAADLEAACGGGRKLNFPAVFVGGGWFGGTERIIATLIREELRPLLKKAGALWL